MSLGEQSIFIVRVQQLVDACLELSIPEAYLLKIEQSRWTLSNVDPVHMIKLERRLQELTKRPIDLRLESKEDKNKRVERTGRGSGEE